MFYKDLKVPNTSKGIINTFLGYNHNSRIREGEFYEMQNLCSSEYPSLSVRKPRNCILSLENDDWREVDASFEGKIESQVSETLAVWKSARITTQEKEKIRISFCAAETIAKAKVYLNYYKDDELFLEQKFETTDVFDETFEIPKEITTYEIKIVGYPIDMKSYNEDMLESSLVDFMVLFYNWNIRGMLLKDGKISYMVGSKIYYDGNIFDYAQYLQEDNYRERVQLISFGVYILVFPLGLYLNTHTLEYGSLSEEYVAGNYEDMVTFVMCDANGEDIFASEEKPEEPKNGDYWLDTSEEKNALYKWSESLDMWVGISSTYIRISMKFYGNPSTFPDMFEEGDAVFMNSGIEEIDKGSIIVKKGRIDNEDGITGFIVVKGMLDSLKQIRVDEDNPLYFRRKIPKLDYVCVSNNRIWGCYSGKIDDSTIVNEIYASKLGDPKNWYSYEGAATDSYALSLGDDGDFTGAFTYQGYPMFFKENVVYKIYGTYPATYQLYTYNCRGVQKGSERSLAVVNEYLMYKSVKDVCVFDGNKPAGVSECFGNVKYYDASAGACLGKYYLSMKNEVGEPILFVFDLDKNLWHKEDDLYLEEFAYNLNGELYGRNRISMYGFGSAKSLFGQTQEQSESRVKWYCETGNMGTTYPEKMYVNAVQMRMDASRESVVEVYLQTDEKPWTQLQILRGEGQAKVYRIPIVKARCNSFRLALKGEGECCIESIYIETEKGSDR